jgi:hypothetical protein
VLVGNPLLRTVIETPVFAPDAKATEVAEKLESVMFATVGVMNVEVVAVLLGITVVGVVELVLPGLPPPPPQAASANESIKAKMKRYNMSRFPQLIYDAIIKIAINEQLRGQKSHGE